MDVTVIKTARLTLRPFTPDDAAAMTLGLRDWDVVQWLTNVPFPYALEDAEDFIQRNADRRMHWAIDAGEGMIGSVSLTPSLGYWLAATYHGQHIMSEATDAIIAKRFAVDESDLVSGHLPENHASRRILQKLGFVDTTQVTEFQVATQEPVDVQKMVLTSDRWAARDARA